MKSNKRKIPKYVREEAREIAREIINLRKRPDFNSVINKGLKALS